MLIQEDNRSQTSESEQKKAFEQKNVYSRKQSPKTEHPRVQTFETPRINNKDIVDNMRPFGGGNNHYERKSIDGLAQNISPKRSSIPATKIKRFRIRNIQD